MTPFFDRDLTGILMTGALMSSLRRTFGDVSRRLSTLESKIQEKQFLFIPNSVSRQKMFSDSPRGRGGGGGAWAQRPPQIRYCLYLNLHSLSGCLLSALPCFVTCEGSEEVLKFVQRINFTHHNSPPPRTSHTTTTLPPSPTTTAYHSHQYHSRQIRTNFKIGLEEKWTPQLSQNCQILRIAGSWIIYKIRTVSSVLKCIYLKSRDKVMQKHKFQSSKIEQDVHVHFKRIALNSLFS